MVASFPSALSFSLLLEPDGMASNRTSTVVPRLTKIIRSRKIAVKRNRKTLLECIENRLMHCNGEIPHRPAKIAHREPPIICLKSLSSEAILRREGSYFAKGSHFVEPEKSSFSEQTVHEAGT